MFVCPLHAFVLILHNTPNEFFVGNRKGWYESEIGLNYILYSTPKMLVESHRTRFDTYRSNKNGNNILDTFLFSSSKSLTQARAHRDKKCGTPLVASITIHFSFIPKEFRK